MFVEVSHCVPGPAGVEHPVADMFPMHAPYDGLWFIAPPERDYGTVAHAANLSSPNQDWVVTVVSGLPYAQTYSHYDAPKAD